VHYFTQIPAAAAEKDLARALLKYPLENETGRAFVKLLDFAPWRLGLSWTAQGAGAPDGFRLSSHFQAIFGVAERRPVGYEALIRGTRADGLPIDPSQLLRSVPEGAPRADLDRQCQRLQVEKFNGLGDRHSRLFLNLDPQVVVDAPRYAGSFTEMLQAQGLSGDRVAVELTESPLRSEERLAEAIEVYRELGCLIVIDDFGAGHSNFDRVWRLKPDIVKIDREMTRRLSVNPVARRMLAGIVSLLRDAGATVCVEGIETEDQALCSIDAGADLVQGFYFARPTENAVPADAYRDVFDHLRDVSARRRRQPSVLATVGPHSLARRSRAKLRSVRTASNVIRLRRRFPASEGAA
jgi:EAL domain-containing protein (putative c-di-GMP-specific phosphodiesterase class I)